MTSTQIGPISAPPLLVVTTIGDVIGTSKTGARTNANFRSFVSRDIYSNASIEATASWATALPTSPTKRHGRAFITGRPLAGDIAHAVDAHAGLANLISEVPGARVEALGQWSARGSDSDGSTQRVELDISLAMPDDGGNLLLAVFEQGASSGGFEELAFRLEVLGESFGEEQIFTSLAEATDYFASLIDLGEAFVDGFRNGGTPGVRAIFEWTGEEKQQVAFGLAVVVVPEPSTALLLGLGLCALRVSQRSRKWGMNASQS